MSVRMGAAAISSTRRRTYRADQEKNSIDLEHEAELADELGFDARLIESVPLFHRPGVRFENQAKFHPRKYLLALLRLLCEGKGCQIYESTKSRRSTARPSRPRPPTAIAFTANTC